MTNKVLRYLTSLLEQPLSGNARDPIHINLHNNSLHFHISYNPLAQIFPKLERPSERRKKYGKNKEFFIERLKKYFIKYRIINNFDFDNYKSIDNPPDKTTIEIPIIKEPTEEQLLPFISKEFSLLSNLEVGEYIFDGVSIYIIKNITKK